MIFWGCIVQQGKPADYSPTGDVPGVLHLSQACLDPSAPKNSKATLMMSPQGGAGDSEYAVVALSQGRQESASLDLVLDTNTIFKVQGNAHIHLTGYFMPQYEIENAEDAEDAEDEGEDVESSDDAITTSDYSTSDDDYSTSDYSDEYSDDTSSDDNSSEEDAVGEKVFFVEKTWRTLPADTKPIIEDITEKEHEQEINLKEVNALPPAQSNPNTQKDSAKQEDTQKMVNIKTKPNKRPASQTDNIIDDVAVKQGKGEDVSTKKQKSSDSGGEGDRQPSSQKTKTQKSAAEQSPKAKLQVEKEKKPSIAAGQVDSGSQRVRRFANGFEIEDVKLGSATGKVAKAGKKVVVKYVGRLKNGTIFDQTKGNKTFTFRLGVGEVIKGWDRGVDGMRVGDVRKLTIPPQMGYGSSRTGPIPANSTLLFNVELVDVKN
jgi:FK506-binding nuclear protein